MTTLVIVFFSAQLVNVILSTLKSVITIKGGKNWAALINAVAYGFNTIVIKSLADISMELAVVITIVTNLIGVYVGLMIVEKFRKDQLWKITVTIPVDEFKGFKNALKEQNVSFIAYETSWEEYKVVDIFSKRKADSRTIKEIFARYNVKYTISANSGTL